MKSWCKWTFFIALIVSYVRINSMEASLAHEKESTVHSLSDQFKALRRAEVDSDDAYYSLTTDMHKTYGGVRKAIWEVLIAKEWKALKKIEKEYKLTNDDLEYLVKISKDTMKVDQKSVICIIKAPTSWLYECEIGSHSALFQDLMTTYLTWVPVTQITLESVSSFDYVATKKSTSNNPSKKISLGPLVARPMLRLSNDFFTYGQARQAFTFAHEVAHLVLHDGLVHNSSCDL